MIVLDASVIVDALLPRLGERHKRARSLLEVLAERRARVYAPRIMLVELASVLSREKDPALVRELVEELASSISVLGEEKLFDLAYELAFEVRGRAVDAYYVAAAKLTKSILVTCDETMADNAKKAGVEAYFFIREFAEVESRPREFPS